MKSGKKDILAIDRNQTVFAQGICEKEYKQTEFLEPLSEIEQFKKLVSEKPYKVKQTEIHRLMTAPVGCSFLVVSFETKTGKYSNYARIKRSLTNEQKISVCDEVYETTKKQFKIK